MLAAEQDDREALASAVGHEAQSVPRAGRVEDAGLPPAIEQSLDNALGRKRLARPGFAENADMLVERLCWDDFFHESLSDFNLRPFLSPASAGVSSPLL